MELRRTPIQPRFNLFQPKSVQTLHIVPNDFILTKGPGKGIRGSNDTQLEDFVNLHWPNEGPLLEEEFNYDYATPPSEDTLITPMAANPPKSKPIRLPNGTLSMPDALNNPLNGTEALQGEEPEYEVEKIVGKSIWSGNGLEMAEVPMVVGGPNI